MELNSEQRRELSEMLTILNKLPPPKGSDTILDIYTDHDICYLDCQCKIFVKDQIKINSGVVVAFDPICAKCDKSLRNTCPLICVTCKKVTARMEPFVDTKTGFEFKGGRAYHIDSCPSCTTTEVENSEIRSVIIEKYIYESPTHK
jgi:hypothetical protein